MQRTGYASLPLHGGKAPSWLTGRMRRLAKEVISIMVDQYGTDLFLERISDPYWFQALGCVLGFDWHSSGVTTTVTGVLKSAISPEVHGIAVCGGKGKTSRKTPTDIAESADKFSFSENKTQQLIYTSKMTAKVDNNAIQAGYQLYHHVLFVSEKGKWAVVQQGLNGESKRARRYHWLSDHTQSFIDEPHNAIACDVSHPIVLDMTARESEENRKVCVDLAKEPTQKLKRLAQQLTVPAEKNQQTLRQWLPTQEVAAAVPLLDMPRNINWDALAQAYETQPANYEEILGMKGVGPATIRGLALVAELVYGEKPSWKDPVKYSFAYGGKDGVPYPVDRQAYDQSIQILKDTVKAAKVGDGEKMRALQGLRRFVPADTQAS